MICTNCRKEIPDDSVYCTYCGQKIENAGFPVSAAEKRIPSDISQRLLLASKTILFSGILLSLFLSLLKFREGTGAGISLGLLIILSGSFLSWLLSLLQESRAELLRSNRRIEAMLKRREDSNQHVFSDGKD